ncbi:MAG: hypothetical protein CMH83_00920 [Nocardioides sp.]|nr:hypothetical protein [Nocardioides sp.]
MSSQTRSSVLPALVGLVLLVAVVAFAVLLPKAAGDQASSGSAGEAPALPDTLPGDLVAADSGDLPDGVLPADQLEYVAQVQEEGVGPVEEAFGPTSVRLYLRADGTAPTSMVVTEGDPGLFIPDGIPAGSDETYAQRPLSLEVVDGVVCSVAGTVGGTPDDGTVPQSVRCQLGSDGFTYQVTAIGLTVEETVAALQGAADAA